MAFSSYYVPNGLQDKNTVKAAPTTHTHTHTHTLLGEGAFYLSGAPSFSPAFTDELVLIVINLFLNVCCKYICLLIINFN